MFDIIDDKNIENLKQKFEKSGVLFIDEFSQNNNISKSENRLKALETCLNISNKLKDTTPIENCILDN